MTIKRCTKCGVEKPATDEFFGHTPSGNLRGECRTCVNARQRTPRARELHRERAAQRRERGGNELEITLGDKKRMLERQGGVCPCCAEKIESLVDSEPDHVRPLSRGGDNSLQNIILTHVQCNREKHNKTLQEHWDWRFRIGRDRVHLRTLLD